MKEFLTIHKWAFFIIILLQYKVFGTIDITFNQLKYVATRLNHFECRRLIAALHYTSYELPNTLAAAEHNVDDEVPCIRHLLHWNSSPKEGKSKTHENLAHRLRQINRNDLADWLGKNAFSQLGKNLDRAVMKAFAKTDEEREPSHPVTLVSNKDYQKEEDPWVQIYVILIAILVALLGMLLTLICAMIINRIRKRKTTYKKLNENEAEEQK